MSSKADPRIWEAVEHAAYIVEVRARAAAVRSCRKVLTEQALAADGRGDRAGGDLLRSLQPLMAEVLVRR